MYLVMVFLPLLADNPVLLFLALVLLISIWAARMLFKTPTSLALLLAFLRPKQAKSFQKILKAQRHTDPAPQKKK